ncbi:hypothetical protein D9M68_602180 [compost metagenome]
MDVLFAIGMSVSFRRRRCFVLRLLHLVVISLAFFATLVIGSTLGGRFSGMMILLLAGRLTGVVIFSSLPSAMVIIACPACRLTAMMIFARAIMLAAARGHIVAVLTFVVVHLGFAAAVLVAAAAGH